MFYAKAACYFSRHTVTNHLRSIIKLDDWTSTLDAVKKADQICRDHATTSFQLSMSQSLKEMNRRWEALQSQEAENRVLKILDWVSQVEVGKQHGEVKDKLKRYSKSGQWLMQLPSFEAWSTAQCRAPDNMLSFCIRCLMRASRLVYSRTKAMNLFASSKLPVFWVLVEWRSREWAFQPALTSTIMRVSH